MCYTKYGNLKFSAGYWQDFSKMFNIFFSQKLWDLDYFFKVNIKLSDYQIISGVAVGISMVRKQFRNKKIERTYKKIGLTVF